MKIIYSVYNEQLKYLNRLLYQGKFRRKQQQAVLEGIHLLQAYLSVGLIPQHIYIPENKIERQEICALIAELPDHLITKVTNNAIAKISSLTEGEEILTLIDLPSFNKVPTKGDCVALDNVQDPGNVGTILRSAAAAGVKQIIISANSADVWSPKVLRAAMGAHFSLELFTRVNIFEWIQTYEDKIWVTALAENNNHNLYELELKSAGAWLFGNEGSGVDKKILEKVDASVKISMLGATESLNVAMAATICLFEQMRQRLSLGVQDDCKN